MRDSSRRTDWRRYFYASNLFGSLAGGLVNPFTVLYALSLGADAALIGVMVSLPPLMTTLTQLLWARVTRLTGRRKPFVVVATLLTSAFWILMGLVQSPTQLVALIGAQSLLVSIGAPAATGLLTSLLKEKERGNVISQSNRYAHMGALVGTFVAGPVIDAIGNGLGYRVAFFAAAVTNLLNVLVYNRGMPDARIEASSSSRVKLSAERRDLLLRLIAVRSIFTVGVSVAGPYIVVYLVDRYQVSNSAVGMMAVVSNLMSILTVSRWGRVVDSYGRVLTLSLGSCLASLVPLLVVMGGNVYLSSTGYVAGGIFWAAVSVSLSAYLMDITQGGDVEGSVALFNAAMGISSTIGPLLGGAIASFTGDISHIFYASGIARFLMGAASYAYLKEVYPHAKEVTIQQVLSPVGALQPEVERGIRFLTYIASRETVQEAVERIGKEMEEVEAEQPMEWVEEF